MDFGNIGSMIESFTYLDSIWLKVWLVAEHIVFFPLKLGGISFLKFGQRGGSLKNCSEIGGLVERGGGGFQIVSLVFLKKSMFSLLLEYFFCL